MASQVHPCVHPVIPLSSILREKNHLNTAMNIVLDLDILSSFLCGLRFSLGSTGLRSSGMLPSFEVLFQKTFLQDILCFQIASLASYLNKRGGGGIFCNVFPECSHHGLLHPNVNNIRHSPCSIASTPLSKVWSCHILLGL